MRFRWFVVVRRILRLFETNPQIVVCIMNEWTVWFLIARLFSRNDVRIVQNMNINLSATLRSIPHWKQATMKFLNRVVLKYCDHIISVSDGVTADLVSHFKVPVTKITTILNGVRIETIQTLISAPIPDWSEISQNRPVFVAVGRMISQKGFHFLLHSFQKVLVNYPARLLILGDGELRSSLEAECDRLGIRDSVVFRGFVANPYKYMARSTVFVSSSLWEAFPYVLLEALAVGIPVIATRCPSGPQEILGSGRYGILVEPANIEEMATAMVRLLADEGSRKQFADTAHSRALDFTAERMCSRYAQTLDTVLKGKA